MRNIPLCMSLTFISTEDHDSSYSRIKIIYTSLSNHIPISTVKAQIQIYKHSSKFNPDSI